MTTADMVMELSDDQIDLVGAGEFNGEVFLTGVAFAATGAAVAAALPFIGAGAVAAAGIAAGAAVLGVGGTALIAAGVG
jgi:hypothetical protein